MPPSAKPAPGLKGDVFIFHLRHVHQGDSSQSVRKPRHFIVFRRVQPDLVAIIRVLHDSMDLPSRLRDEVG